MSAFVRIPLLIIGALAVIAPTILMFAAAPVWYAVLLACVQVLGIAAVILALVD